MNLNELMKEVITYDGSIALRGDCRYIGKEFFIKNKQCFFIEGRWYRINSPKIAFDHEKLEWVIKDSLSSLLYYGVVSCKGSELSYGYFTPNISKNVHFYDGSQIVFALSDLIFEGNPLFTEGVNGIYYNKKTTKVGSAFTDILKPRKEGFYTFPFNYGSEGLIPEFSKVFNKEFVGDPLISSHYNLLEPFTWGVEFETCRGGIPERHLAKNGLIACRDGSITGFEYTTVPLSGKTGIQEIKKACELLNKYCLFSEMESLHIHVGGFPKNIKYIVALYRLCYLIQKEIYSLFPTFYVDTSQFKRKGYCNPLYKVGMHLSDPDQIFNEIYYWLSNGDIFKSFPNSNHPLDRSGQHKWEVSPRYIWLNLIPLIWGNKGTIEFRCHTPTFNSTKVINWLFIIVSIMKYAISHVDDFIGKPIDNIKSASLSNILSECYPADIVKILQFYIKKRISHYSRRSDATGGKEITAELNNINIFSLTPFV